MALTKIDDRGLKTPIDLLDNEKIQLGSSQDLQIYHDGSTSYIDDAGTGILRVRGNEIRLCNTSNETYFTGTENGAAKLYYDDAVKFQTNASGVDITGTLTSDGLNLHDNHTLRLGTDADMLMGHSGSDGYIRNDTGPFYLRSNGINIVNQGNDETYIKCIDDGAVELYYDGSKKFETTSGGVSVTGGLTASGYSSFSGNYIDLADTTKLRLGTGGDCQLHHTSGANFIETGSQIIHIQSDSSIRLQKNTGGENMLIASADGAVELYYNNVKKLETAADRVYIHGHCFVEDGNRIYIENGFTNSYSSINNTGGSNDSNINFYVRNAGTESTALQIQKTGKALFQPSDSNGFEVKWTDVDSAGPFGKFWNSDSVYGGGVQVKNNNARGGVEFLNTSGQNVTSLYHSTGGWHWGGNLILDSGGIGFNDTNTGNHLDDYEEGTWTPVLASTGTAFTSVTNWSTASQNRYTKIGRIVTVQCYHRTGGVDKGSAASTDGIEITGLPFTPTNNTQRTMAPIGQNVNWSGYPNHALVRENIASVELYKYASSGGNNTGIPLTVADVGTDTNNNYAIFTLTYESA